jgi:hypothetical protein
MNTNFPRGHRDGFQNTLDCKVTPRGHAKDGKKKFNSRAQDNQVYDEVQCSAV